MGCQIRPFDPYLTGIEVYRAYQAGRWLAPQTILIHARPLLPCGCGFTCRQVFTVCADALKLPSRPSTSTRTHSVPPSLLLLPLAPLSYPSPTSCGCSLLSTWTGCACVHADAEKREKNLSFRFSIPKIPQFRKLCDQSYKKKKVFSA